MIFTPILATIVSALLGWALLLLSVFLILLILVQRGRGGGLTGALGGPGGQSAFGTKAGDLFTRITSFVALGWIALCAFTMWLIGSHAPTAAVDPSPAVSASPADRTPPTSDMIDFGAPAGGIGGGTGGEAAPQGTQFTPAEPLEGGNERNQPQTPADTPTTQSPATEPAATSEPAAGADSAAAEPTTEESAAPVESPDPQP